MAGWDNKLAPSFNNSTSWNLSLGKTGHVLNSTPPEERSQQSLWAKDAADVMCDTTENYPFYVSENTLQTVYFH